MRLLGVLDLAVVDAGFGRHVRVAVELAGLRAGRRQRRLRQRRRVGTHVGDEAVLVEPLRGAHHLLRRPAELAAGFLLQRARHERRVRTAAVRLLVDALHRELATVEPGGQPTRAGLVEMQHRARRPSGGRIEVASGRQAYVVDADQGRGEGLGIAGLALALGESAFDVPVLGGVEGHPGSFALDDHAGGDRLHPSGGQARQHLLPQHRTDLVAVEAVEDAAGFLCVDELVVDLARIGDGGGDRRRGDLVEHHAAHRHGGLERFDQVPGDRLALAVFICGEVELGGVLDQALELGDLLFAVGADDVDRLEAVLGVDADACPRQALVLRRDVGGVAWQVTDVADRGLDGVVGTEVAADRLRLRRRLDDHQFGARLGRPACHVVLPSMLITCQLPTSRGRYRTGATGTCRRRHTSQPGAVSVRGANRRRPGRRRPVRPGGASVWRT